MDIWETTRWQNYYNSRPHRSGLRISYEKGVVSEVKRAINEFVCWLRNNHVFPKRVRIYVKEDRRIKAMAGDYVCGTFFRPADRDEEPYIRLAAGDYYELVEECGKDNALASILRTLAHELTHYFQWLNDLKLTLIGEERQATNYARKILKKYAETRDHP